MSEEKKREELLAQVHEKLDRLSLEDLEKVAGGVDVEVDVDVELNEMPDIWKMRCPFCSQWFNMDEAGDEAFYKHLAAQHGFGHI